MVNTRTMNALVRAQTCCGCRACEYDADCNWRCSLGFPMTQRKPLAQCPKPRSIRAMVEYSLSRVSELERG
jgi:hypothetical protein